MVKNDTAPDVGEKPQVNVQLEHDEFESLKKICETEGIKRPATLVGIWIRTQLKARSGMTEMLQACREAEERGVDVVATLARAARRAK
jgi:cobalamin biosynthesis Mg chelatase CobN